MYDFLFILISRIRRILNWRIVRGIAELQILTRATYIMLIFVPILAGLWPAVRLYVNNHNEAVVEATKIMREHSEAFTKSKEELTKILSSIEPDNSGLLSIIEEVKLIDSGANNFLDDVKQFSSDFMPRTLKEPNLQWAWAAAFFASLFAVVAHLIYQLATPEIVRKHTLDEFVKSQKEDYSKHPSEDAMVRSKTFLSTKEGKSESDIDERRHYRLYKKLEQIAHESTIGKEILNLSLSELSGLQSYIQSEGDMLGNRRDEILDLVREAYLRNSEKIGGSEAEKQRNMAIIERGARAEYLHWAGRNTLAALFTSLIYAVAIFIIFEIISIQANRVIEMAGWNGLVDLFKIGDQL